METVKTSRRLLCIFGPERGNNIFGEGTFSDEEVERLSKREFPPQKIIKKAAKDHILVAVPANLSILSIEGQMPELFNSKHMYYWRHSNGSFAKRGGKATWCLIKRTPLYGSQEKSWQQQKEMLSGKQYVPDARTVIYASIITFVERGYRLFSSGFVRTADSDVESTRRVVVKFDEKCGMMFYCWDDSDTAQIIGCAVAEKF